MEIIYRNTTKNKRFIICCQFVYYHKCNNLNSIRYTCKECQASLTIENQTDTILKVNGVTSDNNLQDLIISSHKNCKTMGEEEYNNRLSNFLNSHPNIWKFIIKIKSEETSASLAYTRINNDTFKHRRRNKIDLCRDLQIAKLKCKYLENKLNLTELLHEFAKIVQEF